MKKSVKVALFVLLTLCVLAPLSLMAAGKQEPAPAASGEEKKAAPFDIAVFVPGVVAGSPLYEQLVAGAERAVKGRSNVSLKVIEGGFNQGEWGEKLTSLAATGEYEIILTSNPAMPFVAAEVMKEFPKQKFVNVDAYMAGNPQIYTLLYNQVEQAYFVGYLGGLVSTSSMKGANPDLKVGMIVAQEYPALTKMMKPGFEMGLKAVNPGFTLDYRVIGNWYDANKAAELANSMFDAGVDVILVIAGGANQGAIKAASERGKYILYFDAAEYKIAPGVIVGCAVLNQERSVYESVTKAIEGTLEYGRADIVSVKDGYVDFADSDPLYIQHVPADIRAKMDEVVKKMRSGALTFEVPQL